MAMSIRWIAVVTLAMSSACTGIIGDAGEPPRPNEAMPNQATAALSGSTIIRRLNQREYNNTVRDLLGDTTAPAARFSPDPSAYGFTNNAAALVMNPDLVDQYLSAAEGLASRADLGKLVACDPASATDDCVRAFVVSFGRRAFRRPVENSEADEFVTLFDTVRETDGSTIAIRSVLTRILLSPHFLYRVELSGQDGDGPATLSSWELASRLS